MILLLLKFRFKYISIFLSDGFICLGQWWSRKSFWKRLKIFWWRKLIKLINFEEPRFWKNWYWRYENLFIRSSYTFHQWLQLGFSSSYLSKYWNFFYQKWKGIWLNNILNFAKIFCQLLWCLKLWMGTFNWKVCNEFHY